MQRVSILNLVMFFRSFSTQLYFYNVRKYPKFQQNMETYLLVRIRTRFYVEYHCSMLNITFVDRTRVRLKYRKLLKIAAALGIETLIT